MILKDYTIMKDVASNISKYSCEEIKNILDNLKNKIIIEKNQLAYIQSNETGKSINDCLSELDRCIFILNYAKEYHITSQEKIVNEGNYAGILKERFLPIGKVLAITPISSPYSSIIHKLSASLIYRNTVFWKPSRKVIKSSLALYNIIDLTINAHIKNAVNLIDVEDCELDCLLKSNYYDCILFTGRNYTAKHIKTIIGRKPAVFETGSNALAYISDNISMNMDNLIDNVINASFSQNGKRCIALKNLFINENVFDDVFIKIIEKLKMYGYKVNDIQVNSVMEKLKDYDSIYFNVKKLISEGYEIVSFSEKTNALVIVDNNSSMYSLDEFFGPVLCIHKIKDIDDISQEYFDISTLNISIYSNNNTEIKRFISRSYNCGTVCINFGPNKRFDSLPFGGYSNENENKESLGSLKGILTKQQSIIEKIERSFSE